MRTKPLVYVVVNGFNTSIYIVEALQRALPDVDVDDSDYRSIQDHIEVDDGKYPPACVVFFPESCEDLPRYAAYLGDHEVPTVFSCPFICNGSSCSGASAHGVLSRKSASCFDPAMAAVADNAMHHLAEHIRRQLAGEPAAP